MAFNTFRHPDFASKYRNFRVVAQDAEQSPVPDFIPAETFDSEEGLRLIFRMSDADWKEAQSILNDKHYFVFSLGGLMSDLPE